ncbi:hypothetical protein AB7W58_22875 [Providencia rettgeri]
MIQENTFHIELIGQIIICVFFFYFYWKLKREKVKNEKPDTPINVINKRKTIDSILILLIIVFISLIANIITVAFFSNYMIAGIFESIKNACLLPLVIFMIVHVHMEN